MLPHRISPLYLERMPFRLLFLNWVPTQKVSSPPNQLLAATVRLDLSFEMVLLLAPDELTLELVLACFTVRVSMI